MPIITGHDSTGCRRTLKVGTREIAYYSIAAAQEAGLGRFDRLCAALKVVLENMLRFEDDSSVTPDDIRAFADWADAGGKVRAKSPIARRGC